ncbi:MAG TPA: RNA-binding cell elongation regulator Jag/EloR [Selenomonadales bacterium]|nr:RNA-binding cell elongation regulator Jag/EloR [Selenomonadales bacterium]
MNMVEKVGKTIEEAMEAAARELGVARDQLESEVLEEPSKGLFGLIGGKPAKVRAWVKAAPEEPVKNGKEPRTQQDPVAVAKDFLDNVFRTMKLDVKIERMTHADHVTLNLRGDDLGVLIGKHGQTLDALQYLTNLAAHRDAEDRIKIILDVEDYRKRRAETLERLARRLADRVKARGEKVVLEPMSPHERKVIHMTLQEDDRVTTYSEGEEPYRKVVIALKK